MDTIVITGPKGSFEACARTGHIVTPYTQIPPAYRVYSSVDIGEYQEWADFNELEVGKEVGILCIGLRRYDGKYEAPELVYRDEQAYHMMEAQPMAA